MNFENELQNSKIERMSSDIPSVNLWVRPESFNLGTIPLPSPDLFNFKYLKRIISYTKTKSGFKNNILSYSVWEHIACNKFRLHKEVAWLYFENYFLVHLRKIDERIEWDRRLSDATEKDVEEIKSKAEVCSLRFVLMLYLQNIHNTSLCSNIVMQEEYPLKN
ncbi:TBCC domain-containing protein 1-like [Centruroides vittatus]|uniref:TBCC domain-containing protein 1-like n=1 Tax=Centruroides vittatus TaxID=120091 RepID=UPI0035107740